MSKKLLSSLSAIIYSALSITLIPVPAQASECQGNECQITFSYTGQPQTWVIPDGATNISFDVQGASGGRNGGLGGRVTGKLNHHYSQLEILVGGAGLTGASVNGGFNGGGSSGGSRTNEGSGGGASDIRLSDSLDSRIVVAGGGGGTGGFSGGSGGHGGGEIASPGQSGQGGGGGGGTQTNGGYAGTNNGGSSLATSGTFGQGGTGGISWNAGGGGGGGGWFGGGGGGSDDNECCSDGGGGGGGSSFANQSVTSNIQHTSGFRTGNGLVVITYELTPKLAGFSGQQISKNLVLFTLEYNLPITGLEPSDLSIVGEGCSVSAIQANNNRQEILIENCTESPELKIPPNSYLVSKSEPTSELTANVSLDLSGPLISFTADTRYEASVILFIDIEDAVTALMNSSVQVSGCDVEHFVNEPAAQLHLNNCQEGIAEISIEAGALQDSFNNSSLAYLHRLYFDFTPPNLSWSTAEVTGTDVFNVEAELLGSEAFELLPNSLQVLGKSEACTHSISPLETSYLVSISGCTAGEIILELLANSAADQHGNLGPSDNLRTTIQLKNSLESTPVDKDFGDEPTVQIPTQETEAPGSVIEVPLEQPITSPIQTPSIEEIEDEPQLEQAPEPSKPQNQTPVAKDADSNRNSVPSQNFTEQPDETSLLPLDENLNSEENFTNPGKPVGDEIHTKPVVLETSENLTTDKRFLLGALVVLAILSLGGVGALLLRLAENNRSRSV